MLACTVFLLNLVILEHHLFNLLTFVKCPCNGLSFKPHLNLFLFNSNNSRQHTFSSTSPEYRSRVPVDTRFCTDYIWNQGNETDIREWQWV